MLKFYLRNILILQIFPKDSPKLVFHDPRPAKVYANLPEFNSSDATYGSVIINYPPEPGKMMFTNSWLPHTIQRNPSKTPFRLVHWNLGVMWVPPKEDSTNVEVV